jgi:lipid II:glycine glycyltransferase (peptidoglycan interpeptide bridge formation enzyme)
MIDNKKKYHKLCKKEITIPIFSRDWWMNAVCGEDSWDVVLVEESGQVIAALPYYIKKIGFSFIVITMPPLTQTMGPWLNYPKFTNNYDRLEYEKKIFNELINQLPRFGFFDQNFHYSIQNWLPFYWKDFEQTTRYTYIIDDLTDLNSVFSNFSHAKRKNISKAEKIVDVKFDLSAEDFYENHKLTLKKQGKKISYSFSLFEKLYNSCYARNSGRTIYSTDKQGNIHSALFVIWYEKSAYDLISTIDPDFRNSGSATLLIREIIKYVSDKTEKFDFEGSMIEGVEQSFRQFGTVQKPYFNIQKVNSNSFRLLKAIRSLAH